MNFKDTLEYMYKLLPMYQRVGKVAFKKDLTNTIKLCDILGNPQKSFKSIHIAGTNGKGSSAHMLASILQVAGYRTGLYTSPHLRRFTERIKVNGSEVEEAYVCEFIEKIKSDIVRIQPSFFEITVVMAFDYFARQNVDVAVIEVGLGGRFDSTNVLLPVVSLITSIGLDHMDMLGETLPQIAFEKAGIIKEKVAVVVSETQPEIIHVFEKKASEMNAPIYFADRDYQVFMNNHLTFTMKSGTKSEFVSTDLNGEYQAKNIPGVMKVIDLLNLEGFHIGRESINEGLQNVIGNTGLYGRWQKLNDQPLIICDAVHNEAGVKYLVEQLHKIDYQQLHIIWGAVEGKDLNGIFSMLPKDAFYYFCEAAVPRALKSERLKKIALDFGCKGEAIKNVNKAIHMAIEQAGPQDFIFIGGSNFIIAEITELTSEEKATAISS